MAKNNCSYQIDVPLPDKAYSVIIGQGQLKDKAFLSQHIQSSQVLIVSNKTIAPLYLKGLKQACAGKQCDVVILEDGEQYKNQHSLNLIYDELISKHHHRDTTLIALGGGVIGDITGFAASTYQRGVPFIQIPTTLLAQVDASVGGKTAINHPMGKNLIGCFYQPQLVIIDTDTLQSLPQREFKAGFAEVIKYALIVGGDFLSQLRELLQEGVSVDDQAALQSLIAECCKIKADFVVKDEREKGQRALLNLGHTFGHALEAVSGYQRWLHGEAVAIGLYCAALLSSRLGYLSAETLNQIETLLAQVGLAYKIPKDIDLSQLRDRMSLDKKIKDNVLRFVLLKDPCHAVMSSEVAEDTLIQTLLDAVEGEKNDGSNFIA